MKVLMVLILTFKKNVKVRIRGTMTLMQMTSSRRLMNLGTNKNKT